MSRECPICGASDKETLSGLCGNMSILGESFPSCSSNNVTCKQCGCVYVDSEATQADFTKYYNSAMSTGINYYKMFGERQTNEYYQHIYDSFKEYLTDDSQILDFGCGLGDFSKFMLEKGHVNIVAMEVSEVNATEAQRKGVNCLVGDGLSEKPDFEKKFDLIVVSHVLEHIWDSKKVFSNVKKWLKDDGKIYIEVPDAARYCDVDFPPYFFFTYEHVTHYVEEMLYNMENSFGLKLLSHESYLKCESYFVFFGLFQNSGVESGVIYSEGAKMAIEKYKKFSDDRIAPFVRKLEESQEKLILWGIGASTAQLLDKTFDHCRVIKLVDNNPARQGLYFRIGEASLCIEAPETVDNQEMTIVILPTMYKNAIIEQIRSLGFANKVVSLKEG